MGEYVYSLRKAKLTGIEIQGEKVDLNFFSYLCKPHYNLSKMDKASTRLIARANNVWKGTPLPKYIVLGSQEQMNKPRDYFTPLFAVYTNIKDHIWFDCAAFPGTNIGSIEIYQGVAPVFHDLETCLKIEEDNRAEGIRCGRIFSFSGK